jgi:hypothetical protein
VQYADLYECPNQSDEDVGHRDANGDLDPCHEHDSGATCDGTCVPVSPAGWSETVLLWHGALVDQPPCPSWAPAQNREGNADLTSTPASCVACACQPPTGTCALPAKITASNAPTCAAPGNISLSFDPPAGWAGECTQSNAIPAGVLCGGVPCVQSVSIEPLILTETGCMPTIPTPPAPPPGPGDSPTWSTVAITCGSDHHGQCSDPGDTCAPNLPPLPPGFQICVSAFGDQQCEEGFPDKHVFYRDFHDGRSCTPCACDAPSGGTCTGAISVFDGSVCSGLLLTLDVANDGKKCSGLVPGSGLASKSAGPLTYSAGVCPPSGGEPTGALEPITPKTFCCRP